jgi:hypothetical protein
LHLANYIAHRQNWGGIEVMLIPLLLIVDL